MFWETIWNEMCMGNFSFAICVICLVQLILAFTQLKRK